VSVFRPAVRVTAPDGREWEIYAYKLPLRNLLHQPRSNESATRFRTLRVAVRRVRELAVAVTRSLGSDTWTIEALTFLPQKQSYAWTTTREFRGQVLAQVEGRLAGGDVPSRLRNATYLGWSRSAR
jgi:hypothetical protein